MLGIAPYYEKDGVTLLQGDVLAVLAEMCAESVDCVVTSPPYWSLRKYSGDGTVWGGDTDCEHVFDVVAKNGATSGEGYAGTKKWQHSTNGRGEGHPEARHRVDNPDDWTRITRPSELCRCGAWRGQYGLEPTPELYVEHTVTVLRAIRRVLKPTGTVWWNIGDSYASGIGRNDTDAANLARRASKYGTGQGNGTGPDYFEPIRSGLKPKDMVLIPWRVGLAAQADGWWIRSDIIWAKPNPMPESVTDRPTKSHEYILLMAKAERYYFNADAVRERYNESSIGRYRYAFGKGPAAAMAASPAVGDGYGHECDPNPLGRNIRSVWNIATQPSPLPHFASFPEALAERCIKAGCPPDGVVFDPFAGTATTLKAARDLGRKAIGIEISDEYCELARKRLDYGIKGTQAIERGQTELLL